MWRTEALQRSLDGIDGHGIRPVLRAAPAAAAAVPVDMARADSRERPRRHSDSESRRDRFRESASAAAWAVLNRLDLAIVLLHPDRRILLANAAATRVQARGDCFHRCGRKLQLVDRQCQYALEGFLGEAATARTPVHGPLCVAGRDNGSGCYFLFAEWLDVPSERDFIAAVQIHEPRSAGRLEPDLLGMLYGLTRMESRLVAALYAAPILQVAADQCEMALNTAKTHLKHVFAKCGVHSKAELLRLLARGPRIQG
jgi:DNA-binding CsgD family transcriptional regulator